MNLFWISRFHALRPNVITAFLLINCLKQHVISINYWILHTFPNVLCRNGLLIKNIIKVSPTMLLRDAYVLCICHSDINLSHSWMFIVRYYFWVKQYSLMVIDNYRIKKLTNYADFQRHLSPRLKCLDRG